MRLWPVAFALLATCSSPPVDMMKMPMTDPTAGTAFFRFDTTDNIRNNTAARPAIGNVYGSIYLTADITLFGPKDDAGVLEDVFVPNVDLRTGQSDAGYVTRVFPPGAYTFLGALDTDDDGGTDRPSHGDIADLPTTNQFEIVDGGVQVKKGIVFDLLYP